MEYPHTEICEGCGEPCSPRLMRYVNGLFICNLCEHNRNNNNKGKQQ